MTSKYEGKPWRQFLPDVYIWLDKVAVQEVLKPAARSWHIVVATKGDQGVELDAPGLDQTLCTKIQQSCRSLGWNGQAGVAKLLVDEMPILAVAKSQVKAAACQLARQLGLDAASALKDVKAESVVIVTPSSLDGAQIFEGLANGFYSSAVFKERKDQDIASGLPNEVAFLGTMPDDETLRRSKVMAKAIAVTRLIQDAPANWLDPARFAEIARSLAEEFGAVCKVLGRKEMLALGMGSFLGVAQGTPKEPQLIAIEIKGKDSSRRAALVGKGLTFDAGGINIKPSNGLQEMKYDMSGGAAVLGAAFYLSQVKPPVDVVCLIGAVENMLSGEAIRPGDVLQAMNGKTIEVLNTDAEGRLVLADVLAYAEAEYKPALVVDAATLTGAALHALGHAGAALVTDDDKAAAYVSEVAERAGEPVWRLPIWPELTRELKSDLADVANLAKPNVLAGTIIGGLFLKEFAPAGAQWAHLDIAGTAWSCSATGFPSQGGSAFGVRTLIGACLDFV